MSGNTLAKPLRAGSVIAVVLTLGAGSVALGQSAPLNTYIGSSSDWFNAGNWSLGHSPVGGEDVLINGGRTVIIDPANDPAAGSAGGGGAGKVVFQDIHITGNATLETLAGTQITTRNETLSGGGRLIHRASIALDDLSGGILTVLDSAGQSGPVFNPTHVSKRDVILRNAIKKSITFGLGGTTPASTLPGAVGAGHYATLNCQTLDIAAGSLNLDLFYGFTPSIGQTFEIITIGGNPGTGTRIGEFVGLPEEAFVKGFGDVGLYISYAGGDGNDVVLSARAVPEPGVLAVAGVGMFAVAGRRRR